MTIDRIDWHSGGGFPENLPHESGGTHIGMYLASIINNNLQGEMHDENSAEALQNVRDRTITGRDFLIEQCDEKFWDEDLNPEGLAFTDFYYRENYFDDYADALSDGEPTIYHIENTWKNYDRIAPAIDKRFEAWKKSRDK